MQHHGFDSFFDVFSTYYHDLKSIKDDSGYVDEHCDYQNLFKHITLTILLLINWTNKCHANNGDLVPKQSRNISQGKNSVIGMETHHMPQGYPLGISPHVPHEDSWVHHHFNPLIPPVLPIKNLSTSRKAPSAMLLPLKPSRMISIMMCSTEVLWQLQEPKVI